MPTTREYVEPVARLLTYGEGESPGFGVAWPDYLTLGFTERDIPELVRMCHDDALNEAGEGPGVWAPLHSWRALGQLGAETAAGPLVQLAKKLPDDDWLHDELPKVLSMIGPASLPEIVSCLADDDLDVTARYLLIESLEKIGLDHPDVRDECVRVLAERLEAHGTNDETLNGFLVSGLVGLGATSAIATIRDAFAADRVDLAQQGDIEDVEILMGLRETRDTPRPDLRILSSLIGQKARNMGKSNSLHGLGGQAFNPNRQVGRNDPCPCGSGKKFKKCCLAR